MPQFFFMIDRLWSFYELGSVLIFYVVCLWQSTRHAHLLPTCSLPHVFVKILSLSLLLSYAVTSNVSDGKVYGVSQLAVHHCKVSDSSRIKGVIYC